MTVLSNMIEKNLGYICLWWSDFDEIEHKVWGKELEGGNSNFG